MLFRGTPCLLRAGGKRNRLKHRKRRHDMMKQIVQPPIQPSIDIGKDGASVCRRYGRSHAFPSISGSQRRVLSMKNQDTLLEIVV